VCGNNVQAREEIAALTLKKKILLLGYANNVNELMDASDCIVTKPGGITTSETLAKNLPMIICNPIPGQEERNAEFLQNNGAAIAVGGAFSLSDAVGMLFYHPEKVEQMKASIAKIRKPNSTIDICEWAERLVRAREEDVREVQDEI
jgi:processive 1,2-diacylglycerol beta-glucosyltransferase